MPTLVRTAAPADRSILGDNHDDDDDDETTMDLDESLRSTRSEEDEKHETSAVLDTSVNMLLDDTIHSDSGSDSESTVSHHRTTNSVHDGSLPNKQKNQGGNEEAPCRRRPDSNRPKFDEQPQKHATDGGRPKVNSNNNKLDNDHRGAMPENHRNVHCASNHESRLSSDSDSSSFLDTPPRRQKDSTKSTKSQSGGKINQTGHYNDALANDDDNDETRLSDDNDETRLESPPLKEERVTKTTQLEKRHRPQDASMTTTEPRRPTPEELEWRQQKDCHDFRAMFQKTVSNFERRNPRVRLRDYQSLSSEEQVKEQQKVINLLDRLGIRRKSPDEQDEDNNRNNHMRSTLDDTAAYLDQTILQDQDMSITRSINSPINNTQLETKTEGNRRATQSQGNKASLLAAVHHLSPIGGNESFGGGRNLGNSQICQNESPMFTGGNDDHSVSDLSVEITRGAEDNGSLSPYLSPQQLQLSDRSKSKRLASTSGKRGKDSSRVKLNNEASSSRAYSPTDSDGEGMPPPAPSFHSSDDDSFSLVSAHDGYAGDQRHPFSASQSPIAAGNRHAYTQKQRRSRHDDYRESSRSVHWPPGSRHEDKHSRIRHRSPSHDENSNHNRHASGERSSRGDEKSSSRRRDDNKYDDSRHRSNQKPSSSQRRDKHGDGYMYQDDTIDTVNATTFRGPDRRTRLRDSTNVQLKEGVPFHYNPLHIKRSKRTSQMERLTKDYPRHHAVDFRDPLGDYVGEDGEQLYHAFQWMHERDNVRKTGKWNSDSKGVVFSLDNMQIINVTIKLLMENDGLREDRFSFDDISSLSGQTLIVVRSKEDIATWEHALREHTPFSVISHADLPSSKRKRSSTASECATYDITLSTFDAMKNQDSTVQLDQDGHVCFEEQAESQALGGWMTKRVASSGASSQRVAGGFSQRLGGASQRLGGKSQRVDLAATCKQLSVLHRIQWRRILFVDDLGRKCFLAKHGTARAQAAASVNGDTRFIFFTKEKEEIANDRSAFESLMKSDKRAIQSVSAALRIDTEGDDEDDDLLDVILDPAQGI